MKPKLHACRKLKAESLESRQLLYGGAFTAEPPTAAELAERAFTRLNSNEDDVITIDEVSERVWDRISEADTDTAEGEEVSISQDELTAHIEAQMEARAERGQMGPMRRGQAASNSGGEQNQSPFGRSRGRMGPARFGVQTSTERLDSLFENDTNDDGLSSEEVPERVWERISEADTDTAEGGEVTVTREELEAQIEARQAERFDAVFSRLDADESGEITAGDVPERIWDRVSAADTDTVEGEEVSVSPDELQAHIAERRAETKSSGGMQNMRAAIASRMGSMQAAQGFGMQRFSGGQGMTGGQGMGMQMQGRGGRGMSMQGFGGGQGMGAQGVGGQGMSMQGVGGQGFTAQAFSGGQAFGAQGFSGMQASRGMRF